MDLFARQEETLRNFNEQAPKMPVFCQGIQASLAEISLECGSGDAFFGD